MMKLSWRGPSHASETWHKKGLLALLIALVLTFVMQTAFSNDAFAQSATNTTNHAHHHYSVQDPSGNTSNIISDETIQTTSSEQVVHVTLHVSDVHNHPLEDIHATVVDHVQGHGEASVTLAINDQDFEEHTSFQGETTVNNVFASPNPTSQPTLSAIHSYGGFSNVAQQGYDPQHRLVRVARTHAESLWFHVGINPTLDGDWDQFRDAVTEYIQSYRSFLLSGLQVFASLLLGVAIASVNWEAWQKAVPHHFEWQTTIAFFIIATTFSNAAGIQGLYNYWKKMRDAQDKAEGLIQSMRFRQGPPPPPPGGTGGYHVELR
jgi:hypothetical protein